jgi:uncharacterized cofD-like protein
VTVTALGLALVLTHLYRTAPFPAEAYYLTLQFVPRLERGLLLLALGVGLLVPAFLGLQRTLLGALLPSTARDPLALALDQLGRRRARERGLKVVAIGGGTGLSTLLRGLKELPVQLTAVVTVCDDGGSSGRLRRDLRIPPPGDFRQCLAALAEVEPLVTQLFEHRFATGEGLAGHSFGNVFIAALTQLTGSFERAVEESGRVLATRGRILPATLEDCTLCAELVDRATVRGESQIPAAARASGTPGMPGAIARVYLDPPDPAANPAVVRALLEADLIVLGPGSLYTSILPNLLVPDLARALSLTPAYKLYVCNVATQPGETDGYDVPDFVNALLEHFHARLGAAPETTGSAARPFGTVLLNDNLAPRLSPDWEVTRPALSEEGAADLAALGVDVLRADVVQPANPTRHDPQKLARAVLDGHAVWQRSRRQRNAQGASRYAPGGWWPLRGARPGPPVPPAVPV